MFFVGKIRWWRLKGRKDSWEREFRCKWQLSRKVDGFPGGPVVKNLPGRQKTWVWFLGQEDPLKKGMATHSSIFAWRIPMAGGAWLATVHGVAKSWIRLTQLSRSTCRGISRERGARRDEGGEEEPERGQSSFLVPGNPSAPSFDKLPAGPWEACWVVS